jgi:hypothetical protein
MGTYTEPPVSSRAIYDWSSINLATPNYFQENSDIYSVQLDQIIFNTQRQSLALQLAWYRENNERRMQNVVGTCGVTNGVSSDLYIDPNERLVDGTDNPYFLKPYIMVGGSTVSSSPIDRDTYRAQLAYKLDLRQEKGFLRWLGMHELSAFGEYKDITSRTIVLRPVIVSNNSWIPTGYSRGSFSGALGGLPALPGSAFIRYYYRMYVGDAVGNDIDYSPGVFDLGRHSLHYGNTTTGFVTEDIDIGTAVFTGTNGGSRVVQKARGLVLQSFFLKDRIVTTYGVRTDQQYSRNAVPFAIEADGINLDYSTFGTPANVDWTRSSGPTRTAGVVLKPFSWLRIYANRSDSFQPSAPARDLYLRFMPDTCGHGNEYGLGLSLFNNRLVLRANQYETTQEYARNGNSTTYAQRMRRVDFNIPNMNASPTLTDYFNLQRLATGWVQTAAAAKGQTLTSDQMDSQVAAIMGLPVEQMAAPTSAITASDVTLAKGKEIELTYNPSPYWTMKLNVTQQKAINATISQTLFDWYNQRMAFWQTIIDPTTGQPWFTHAYVSKTPTYSTASAFVAASVTAPVNLLRATEGQAKPQVRQYRINYMTNFRLAGVTQNRILKNMNIGGAIRWEDKGAIGYYAMEQLPAVMTAYDPNRPVWDKAHLYADLLVGYRTRLFSNKVGATFQLNVRNILEGGRLQPVSAYPDGQTGAYRIIDPRLYIFSVTLDF